MDRKTKITAIILTLNEEINIVDAIKSVNFADEIIVIDSFSNDNTVELAKLENVRLLQHHFVDFSSQKYYAIEQATHNWIYVLDVDERVTPELKKEIQKQVESEHEFVGFYVYRTFYFIGRRLNFSGWQRDKVIRLFRKDKCRYNGKFVHESIKDEGKIGFFKNKLEHYSYRSYDPYTNKLNHYSSLKAQSLDEKGKSVTPFMY